MTWDTHMLYSSPWGQVLTAIPIQLPVHMHLGRQWMMAQELGSLPATWGAGMGLQPGQDLAVTGIW